MRSANRAKREPCLLFARNHFIQIEPFVVSFNKCQMLHCNVAITRRSVNRAKRRPSRQICEVWVLGHYLKLNNSISLAYRISAEMAGSVAGAISPKLEKAELNCRVENRRRIMSLRRHTDMDRKELEFDFCHVRI